MKTVLLLLLLPLTARAVPLPPEMPLVRARVFTTGVVEPWVSDGRKYLLVEHENRWDVLASGETWDEAFAKAEREWAERLDRQKPEEIPYPQECP